MALKKQAQLTLTKLAIRDVKGRSNPLSESVEGGVAENVIPQRGRIQGMYPLPFFTTTLTGTKVWKLVEFKFVRNSAPETQFLIFKSNGKIYKRVAQDEMEVFPGKTSFSILSNKPCVVSIANRLHVTDGSQYLIYDGWDWFTGGLAAPTASLTTALVGGSLTGTFSVCVTAVHQINGVTIHESSRSPITSGLAPAAQNIQVTKPTLDSRATHWSVYLSEISGAGSRMRRVATNPTTTTTATISALPAATNPFAPIRNDPPQASRVLFQWKNRLGMADRTDGRNFWFTAFEEVAGNLNGAPEESVPGRSGSSSLSDLSNTWTLPDKGETLRAGCWHENFGFLGTDRNCYVIQGEGGLLDNRSLRDFFPLHQFSFGVAGPWSMLSTPYGLVVLTNDRRLMLWEGGTEVTDIGEDIQKELDSITSADLYETEFVHWQGNGRDWLALITASIAKIYLYDFAAQISQPGGGSIRGAWFHLNSGTGQGSACVFRPDDSPLFLIGSATTGTTNQFDAEVQPAHLGLSCVLGKTYLGSSVATPFGSVIRTSVYSPQPERFVRGSYLTVTHRLKDASENNAIVGADPTVLVFYDLVSPDGPGEPSGTGSTLTFGSRMSDKEQRAWMVPSTGASACGALAKRFCIQLSWPGTDTIAASDGSGRLLFYPKEILNLAFAWTPTDILSQ